MRALGVCLAMAAATAPRPGSALLARNPPCRRRWRLPTRASNSAGSRSGWGRVPFTNVKDVFVKTRGMAGQTAQGAYWQGFLSGGLVGGFLAQSRFDPDESSGFVIKLADSRDLDTFWPKGASSKRIRISASKFMIPGRFPTAS